jgi:hypothetical protein
MSISSISSNSYAYPTPDTNNRDQFRTDFSNLATALSSGDLSGAQSAFSALQQLQPGRFSTSPNAGGTPGIGATSSIGADIATLGDALKSGNLTAAQDAFKKVQQDMQSMHHGHHHHKQVSSAQSDPTSTSPSATTDPLTNGQLSVTA